MIIIGSQALRHHGIEVNRLTQDVDFIATLEEYQTYKSRLMAFKVVVDETTKKVLCNGTIKLEFDIALEGDSNNYLLEWYNPKGDLVYAPKRLLLDLKLSHRYKKDSPHFYKTMSDIKLLRESGADKYPSSLSGGWYNLRENETYNYNHPNLKVTKGEFFKDDEVEYIYDHDSIHLAVKLLSKPAYTYFKPTGSDVYCSRELFERLPHFVQLASVYEEACVLSLERSLIPYNYSEDPDKVFRYALMKLCTSISSGWWREFAWENHEGVLNMHTFMGCSDYVERFQEGLSSGVVVKHNSKQKE